MEQKFIITIGRQYGSGGREIGKRLSQLFNIAYYDKELIKEASKESGLNAEYFENELSISSFKQPDISKSR